jgi:hypothetical protein
MSTAPYSRLPSKLPKETVGADLCVIASRRRGRGNLKEGF